MCPVPYVPASRVIRDLSEYASERGVCAQSMGYAGAHARVQSLGIVARVAPQVKCSSRLLGATEVLPDRTEAEPASSCATRVGLPKLCADLRNVKVSDELACHVPVRGSIEDARPLL